MPSSSRASGAYARVDPEAPSGAALRSSRVIPNEIARARKESLERLSNKVQAFVVVVVAALTLYLSDVVRVALFDENVVGCVPFEIVPWRHLGNVRRVLPLYQRLRGSVQRSI
jgi:hypothetical protein